MTTTATGTVAFIPGQRQASDPTPTPTPAAPAAPVPSAPRIPSPATPDNTARGQAARPAAVRVPETAAERRAYALEVAASGSLEAAIDVATFQIAQRTTRGRAS